MSDVTFQNNSKICIASGVTLTIQNNINSSGNVTFEIAGTLQFNQSPNISANLTINIANGGTLRAGTSGGIISHSKVLQIYLPIMERLLFLF